MYTVRHFQFAFRSSCTYHREGGTFEFVVFFAKPNSVYYLYLLPYEFLFDCENHGIIIIWMEKSEFWSMFVNPQAVVCINCYLIVDA